MSVFILQLKCLQIMILKDMLHYNKAIYIHINAIWALWAYILSLVLPCRQCSLSLGRRFQSGYGYSLWYLSLFNESRLKKMQNSPPKNKGLRFHFVQNDFLLEHIPSFTNLTEKLVQRTKRGCAPKRTEFNITNGSVQFGIALALLIIV